MAECNVFCAIIVVPPPCSNHPLLLLEVMEALSSVTVGATEVQEADPVRMDRLAVLLPVWKLWEEDYSCVNLEKVASSCTAAGGDVVSTSHSRHHSMKLGNLA